MFRAKHCQNKHSSSGAVSMIRVRMGVEPATANTDAQDQGRATGMTFCELIVPRRILWAQPVHVSLGGF